MNLQILIVFCIFQDAFISIKYIDFAKKENADCLKFNFFLKNLKITKRRNYI